MVNGNCRVWYTVRSFDKGILICRNWDNFSNQVNNLIQKEGIRFFIKNYRIIFGMIGVKGLPARALCYYFVFKPSWLSA